MRISDFGKISIIIVVSIVFVFGMMFLSTYQKYKSIEEEYKDKENRKEMNIHGNRICISTYERVEGGYWDVSWEGEYEQKIKENCYTARDIEKALGEPE